MPSLYYVTTSGMFDIFPRQSNQVTAKPLKRRTINNRLSQVSLTGHWQLCSFTLGSRSAEISSHTLFISTFTCLEPFTIFTTSMFTMFSGALAALTLLIVLPFAAGHACKFSFSIFHIFRLSPFRKPSDMAPKHVWLQRYIRHIPLRQPTSRASNGYDLRPVVVPWSSRLST